MFHCLPNSAWAVGNLAEAAGQDDEHPNQSQLNPGPRADLMGHPVQWTSLSFDTLLAPILLLANR